VLVLREPLRLIATHRSNRVAQIVRETEVLPGAGVIRGVLDNQLPQFVRALPANQIFNSSSHGISNGRKHARAEVPESQPNSVVCAVSIGLPIISCNAHRPPAQHLSHP